MEAELVAPKYIWGRDRLRALLQHPWEEVQSWAACRILELYPEARHEMLTILPQAAPAVAFHVLETFQDMPLPKSAVGPLLDLCHREQRPADRALAAVLLARCGHALPDEDLASLPLSPVVEELAVTEPGFQFLVRRFLQQGKESSEEVVYGVACACASGDLYELLCEVDDGRERRKTLVRMESLWNCRLPDLRRVKDSEAALQWLQESLAETGPAPAAEPVVFPALLRELDQVRQRCGLLAKAIRERAAAGGETSPRGVPLLLACALGLRRDAACRKALLAAQRGDELWAALTMRPWCSEGVDEQVIALLRGQEPGLVLSSLKAALSGDLWVYSEYACRCLLAAAVPGWGHLLLEALEGNWGADVAEEAEGLLRRVGPEVVGAALEHWRQRPPRAFNLWWLEVYPTPEVVQFLLQHFEHYLSSPGSRDFLEVLGEVGSRDFLEPLLREWRPGEVALGNTIRLIAELNGARDQRLGQVIRDTEEWGVPAPGDEVADVLPRHHPLVPLRCTACGRTYHYRLEKLYTDREGKDVVIGEIVACKGCGSIETYERTAESYLALSAELIRSEALHQAGEGSTEDMPLKGQLMGVRAAGREFSTVSQAYHFLRRAVAREPQNADLRKRLANVLRNGGRPDLALPHYQEALRLNSEDAEVAYSVAAILLEQRRFREAIPYVEQLPRLIREGKIIDDGLRRDLFSALLHQVSIISEQTGHQIPLWPRKEPAVDKRRGGPLILELKSFDLSDPAEFERAYQLFRHGVLPEERRGGDARGGGQQVASQQPGAQWKVGRNEPCPCGSGKKFKRCCGR